MAKIFSALCTMLLFVAFTPSKTHADPIVITSGTLTVTGLVGGPRYSFSGNNFSASGGGDRGALGLQARAVFTSGSVVDVGATFAGSQSGASRRLLYFHRPTHRCPVQSYNPNHHKSIRVLWTFVDLSRDLFLGSCDIQCRPRR